MNTRLSFHTKRQSSMTSTLAMLALLACAWMTTALAQSSSDLKLDVPYVPTPRPIVDRMLDMAKVGKNDVLYDLGCGDGRIVITAAKERGARGIGIDLNPQRIEEAKANAQAAGVSNKVKFMVGDLFKANFADADVVTLYLLPSVNRELRPQLWKQLKVGARVVSHDFDMGPEWPPEKVENIGGKTLYYWTITPANKAAVS
ncbi:class I SAM-dependent methyltransferase [Noviherbaspirillum massiliense]|uniref:class I SAM-dependent methyltransferase n=1 Tax=Noviherbaspirillum massiliense TaxID=1465823 RepID=UPI0003054B90|nr:class I SAM-dependent methyltransferase [Noviherbaspirillum massiliense]